MRKLLTMATLITAGALAWRAWQRRQENAQVWAAASDRVR